MPSRASVVEGDSVDGRETQIEEFGVVPFGLSNIRKVGDSAVE
jgi:hypothetical protein